MHNLRDILARLKKLAQRINDNKAEQIVIDFGDGEPPMVFKSENELIDTWLAGIEDEK